MILFRLWKKWKYQKIVILILSETTKDYVHNQKRIALIMLLVTLGPFLLGCFTIWSNQNKSTQDKTKFI